MILGKFLKDFGKNKKAKDIIEEIVTDYFTKEKVTEDSLKALKTRVRDATANIKGSCTSLLIQKAQKSTRRVSNRSKSRRSRRRLSNHSRSPVKR
jgi:cob(I)alamin adenosyltransferase